MKRELRAKLLQETGRSQKDDYRLSRLCRRLWEKMVSINFLLTQIPQLRQRLQLYHISVLKWAVFPSRSGRHEIVQAPLLS